MSMKVDENLGWRRLVYWAVIFMILTIAFWTMSMYESDEALRLFTFAATITSIVLACVSIVLSLVSGIGTYKNLGSMRDASDKIGNVSDGLVQIKDALNTDIMKIDALGENMSATQDQLHSIIEALSHLQEGVDNLTLENNQHATNNNEKNSTTKFDIENSSIAGALIVYACFLASEKKKNFPAALIGNPFYVHGYITALEISVSKYFRATGLQGMIIHVEKFEKNYFGKATDPEFIMNHIQKNGDSAQAKESLAKIKAFFEIK